MEDYDKFIQHRLSCVRRGEEEHKPSPASSLIRFYGQPILPTLLSGEQREEMRRHRDEAQKAAVHRKLKDESRMAYVQIILHSVQLRKTPTLEELLQESEINTKSSYSQNTSGGSVSQNSDIKGTKDSLLLSPPPERKEKDSVSLPPLTSTTYSAFFASNVTPQQSYQEGCLIDQCSQPGSLNGASHQSSGYVTYENVENTTSVSGGIDAGRESRGFGSSEGIYNLGGFFLHNASNTIAKMPDIFSHPPIDGEELERSGFELNFSNDFIAVEDRCCSPLQEDSVTYLPEEKSESSHLDSTAGEDDLPLTTRIDLDKDHNLYRMEDRVSSSENSGFSDNPKLSQTLSTHHCLTTELHVQHDPTETEQADSHVDEEKLSEEPYRLSLQALLKKSQEYRRCQRMLRNQAKNTKIQERTQEQTRARAEEQSLSDKENDEFSYKGTVIAERKKAKDRSGTFIPSVETLPKKSWVNERMIESEYFGNKVNIKSESTYLTEDGNTKDMTKAEEETTFKNNMMNISQETSCPTAFNKRAGKYHTIPAPHFCRSPVHCKSKGSIQDGEAVDGAEASKKSLDIGLNKDHEVEEVYQGHQNSPTVVLSTVNLVVEDLQHIDQLESNLSSLKERIPDLESTENFRNFNLTESNMQSEFTFEGIKHSEQIENEQHRQLRQSDCDYWKDKLRDDDGDSNEAEQDQRWQGRQSLDHFKNMHENVGPEPNISDTNDVPLIVQVKGTEVVKLGELRLVKTLATERGKVTGTCKEGLTKSCGQHACCRKQQPPAKCILSVTQRLRIPDVFRNVPSETTAPRNVSVLSDASNHPMERRNETAVEAPNSTPSPSLNQSYDVDTPSGLWLLGESGSDLGSKGRVVPEKRLTPESGGKGQGGLSKVKRRLLMHVTEETQERRADTSGRACSVVRPNSSTPRATLCQHEGHSSQKDKQEQLKQAHAAQIRALQDEHRRQQEELLQTLAERYRLLQSVSFPCSMSGSHPGDTLTFSTLSQPSSPLLERYRPLLLALVKGFLTRRLLRTEKVAQLVRTIRDTQQLLQTLQQQSPGRTEFSSRQDLVLKERVTLQLRAARYEVNDIFFSLSAGERMQLISWDRELARERELRRQSGHTGHPRGKSSLSAATQKSLERKRGLTIQKKAAGRRGGVVARTGYNTGLSGEQPLEIKRGQFRANPQRVPKSTNSSRPR